jgi:hypothetical protein
MQEESMNYGELFSKAWKIIWRFKVLWVFGILASCVNGSGGGGGGGGGAQSNFSFDERSWRNSPFSDMFPGMENFFRQLERGFDDGTAWAAMAGFIGVIVVLICLLWVVSIVLGTFGRIGMVRGAWLADEGAEKLTFSQLWNSGKAYFWRVLLFSILLAILGFVLGLLLIIPIVLFTVFTLGCGLLCLIPIMILIGWLINAWVELSVVAIVGEDLDLFDGMRRAWDLVWANIGPVALVTVIASIGAGIIGFLIALPFFLIILPIALGIAANTNASVITGLAIAAVVFVLYLPVAILLGGILRGYVLTVWTLLFRRLTGRMGVPLVEAPADAPPAAPAIIVPEPVVEPEPEERDVL